MTKKFIKKLAEVSYSNDSLSKTKVERIARSLKREDLKVYIKNLKNMDAKKTVTVTMPSDEGIREIRDHFTKIYPNKRILFNVDSTLLVGIRVVDYDNVYELSLKGFLENSLKGTRND